jgi:hypothetical protein
VVTSEFVKKDGDKVPSLATGVFRAILDERPRDEPRRRDPPETRLLDGLSHPHQRLDEYAEAGTLTTVAAAATAEADWLPVI